MLDINDFTDDIEVQFFPYVKCYDSERSYFNSFYSVIKINFTSRFSMKLFTNDVYTTYIESLGCLDNSL